MPGPSSNRQATTVKEILTEIERWQQEGEAVVVATVVANRRSAPRPVGSSLAVSESGKLCGSVSGGCVEGDVFEQAQEVFATGEPKLHLVRDQRRGGLGRRPALRRRDRRLRRAPPVIARLLQLQRDGGRAVVLTVVEGEGLGSKLLVVEGGETRRRRPARAGRARRRADPRRAQPDGRARGPHGLRRGLRAAAAAVRLRRRRHRRGARGRRRSCSAGGRSSPTRARSSRRASGCRAPTS